MTVMPLCINDTWRINVKNAEDEVTASATRGHSCPKEACTMLLPKAIKLEFEVMAHESDVATGRLCLAIKGRGIDNNGDVGIDEGVIAPSGECFWIEKGRKSSRRSLVTGRFVACHRLLGEWASNNGHAGNSSGTSL